MVDPRGDGVAELVLTLVSGEPRHVRAGEADRAAVVGPGDHAVDDRRVGGLAELEVRAVGVLATRELGERIHDDLELDLLLLRVRVDDLDGLRGEPAGEGLADRVARGLVVLVRLRLADSRGGERQDDAAAEHDDLLRGLQVETEHVALLNRA